MDNPRELALKSLVKTDTGGAFSNIEINTALERANLSYEDRGLYTALYLGVLEKRITLDYIIAKYSKIPLGKIDLEALNALRLGIYQIMFMDKIPDYSATDESVSLVAKKSRGFVNAILRSFLRDGKKIDLPKEKWERVSIEYSYPLDIINIFISSYGENVAYDLITRSKSEKGLSLRVNTLKAEIESVLNTLRADDDNATLSKYTDDVIKTSLPISCVKQLIDDGVVFVQDEASRLCSIAVGAKENDTVLDACACPGGKSFSMAIDMKNKGRLISCDLHKSKLSLIEKGAKRLGIDIIEVYAQNGKEKRDDFEGGFDKVLCDVPCSGLGIIFKKPDIKYKPIESINNLPRVQYEILENCKNYVKVGGELIYSTCTLNKEENEVNVTKFLKANSDFEPVDFYFDGIKSRDGMCTLMPHINNTDGFFIAKMKRIK